MLLKTNEWALAMPNKNGAYEERKALLQEWVRWGDVYTGTLKVLAQTWTRMPPEAEAVVLKNAQRALRKCQDLQAQFEKHVSKHGC